MMVVKLIDFLTVLPVPHNDFTVLASSRQIPITLANIEIGDHILVTVERGLEAQGVAVPDFYNAKLN